MGMAGGAYQGDKDREQFALQAAQLASQRRAQDMAHQRAQAQLEEQARQADMADARANRAMDIQEQGNQLRADQQNAMLQERMRQNDMMDASRQRGLDIRDQIAAARQRAQDARLAKLAGQNDIFGQFQQVCDAEQKQTKARQARGQATMASMMKMGMLKGGIVPMAAINFANRQFGFDGKSQAIGAAGFMQNGNFFIDFLKKDPQSGQISRNTQVFNYEDMGRVLYSQAGIFDNKDRQQWRDGMAKRGYSAQEINSMAGMNAIAIEQLDDAGRQRLEAGFADPTATNDDWKAQYTRRKQEIDLALAERKLAKQLGQSGLTPAQKYALYHFNEFAQPQAHEATQEDVAAGRAKKVGDQVYTQTTPDQAFKAAVEFFNKNAQTSDPAVNPVQRDPNAQPPPSDESQAGQGGGQQEVEEDYGYGQRPDGTNKGRGWLGELKLPDGGVATEYSVGVNIGGKEMDIPTLVPTLTQEEVDTMVNDIIPNRKPVPKTIVDKAAMHAKQMLSEGRSVFATGDDSPASPAKSSPSNSVGQDELDFGGAADPEDKSVGQDELDFGVVEEPEAPESSPEASVEGGDAPVQAAEGGEVAPPPPAQAKPPADEPKSMAGAAGGVSGEGGEETEDDKLKDNPFAKWVKRGKARK